MANSSLVPLKVKTLLADTPKGAPTFSVPLERANGRKVEAVDPRATRAMVALMDMQAQMGGAASHWGGPSAFAELMSALHAVIFDEARLANKSWFDLFHFVNDAGHCENGLYALRANYRWGGIEMNELKKFRSIESRLTGHGEAHLFPEGVLISNGPLGSGLPQAQGLALADHLAGRNRVTVCAMSDGGCMEGEAREALAAIPGFAARGKLAPFVMVISDNNTKLTGRIDQDSFSMAPTFASLAAMGWKVIHLADGHDLDACLVVMEDAIAMARKNPRVPIAIHAKTIKGYGVEKTAKAASGGHGFPLKEPKELAEFLKEIYKGDYPAPFQTWADELTAAAEKTKAAKASETKPTGAPSEKVQVGVAKALNAKRAQGLPIVSVTSDLPGSTGVADFHKQFPDSAIDVGVAEANMISTAIGLSKLGYIPVVDTFSQFAVTKGNLPMIMSSLSQGPVIGILSHAGFQDAADGASHQALSYFAATAAIPHTDIHALSSSSEAEAVVGQAIEYFANERQAGRVPRSQLFFLGRENFPRSYLPDGYNYQLGKAQVVYDQTKEGSKSVTLVAAGALLGEALKAATALADKGIGAIVINPGSINHPDVRVMAQALEKTGGRLVTAEDHQAIAGMGAILVHSLAQAGVKLKVRSLGVRDAFGQSAYEAKELYRMHEMDAGAIAAAAQALVNS